MKIKKKIKRIIIIASLLAIIYAAWIFISSIMNVNKGYDYSVVKNEMIVDAMASGSQGLSLMVSDSFIENPVSKSSYNENRKDLRNSRPQKQKNEDSSAVISSSSQNTVDADIEKYVENRKIIKSADFGIVVDDIKKTSIEIENRVRSLGGYIANKNFWKDENSNNYRSARYTIRVPAKGFDNINNSIKKSAIKILREEVTGRDVTAQYTDTELRIQSKRKEAKRYEDLLDNAKDTKAVLNIVRELNRVIAAIEMEEGRLRNLDSRVTMSTINLNLTSKKDVQVGGVIWEPIQEIKEAYNEALVELKKLINDIIHGIPQIIIFILKSFILLLTLLISYKIIRKIFSIFIPNLFINIKKILKTVFDYIKDISK